MSVKICITREVSAGKVEGLAPLPRRMRPLCIAQSGYISGQTLKRLDRPDHRLAIGTWRSMRDWNNCFSNDQRHAVQMEIDTCSAPRRFMVCTHNIQGAGARNPAYRYIARRIYGYHQTFA
jgi:heme-degrading monooxygenase HmoA